MTISIRIKAGEASTEAPADACSYLTSDDAYRSEARKLLIHLCRKLYLRIDMCISMKIRFRKVLWHASLALKQDDTHDCPSFFLSRCSICFLETGLYIVIPIDFEFNFGKINRKINSLSSGTWSIPIFPCWSADFHALISPHPNTDIGWDKVYSKNEILAGSNLVSCWHPDLTLPTCAIVVRHLQQSCVINGKTISRRVRTVHTMIFNKCSGPSATQSLPDRLTNRSPNRLDVPWMQTTHSPRSMMLGRT